MTPWRARVLVVVALLAAPAAAMAEAKPAREAEVCGAPVVGDLPSLAHAHALRVEVAKEASVSAPRWPASVEYGVAAVPPSAARKLPLTTAEPCPAGGRARERAVARGPPAPRY